MNTSTAVGRVFKKKGATRVNEILVKQSLPSGLVYGGAFDGANGTEFYTTVFGWMPYSQEMIARIREMAPHWEPPTIRYIGFRLEIVVDGTQMTLYAVALLRLGLPRTHPIHSELLGMALVDGVVSFPAAVREMVTSGKPLLIQLSPNAAL